ncbi:hypothetical protein GCM10023169_11070 [Georgenia halophila]|uniref:N-acetyltransferase domain-containing protein n=1 Tax=Georgenia halophila TaxID=620889 RepID=A0ABP8L0W5_9MICO
MTREGALTREDFAGGAVTTVPLAVEAARPEDFARIGEIGVVAYSAADSLQPSLNEEYAEALRSVEERATHGVVLVARAGGVVLGSLTLAPAGSRWADLARDGEVEVRMLAVDPGVQGRGAGEALLRGARRWAEERGHRALVLSVVSTDGPGRPHRLYARMGFRRDQARDYVGWWEPQPSMWVYELPLE